MLRIGRPVRVTIVAAVSALVITAFPVMAATTTAPVLHNAEAPEILVTEFQTNGGSASQEFIELYNNTDEDIVFDDAANPDAPQWKLQFFNSASVKTGAPVWATAPSTSNSIVLTGTISAHDYFLISSTDYLPSGVQPDMSYSASSAHLMTDTGGALQLISVHTQTAAATAHDRVMWLAKSGSTVLPQGVLTSPGTGKSLQRIPNDDAEYLGAEGLIAAFGPEDAITPLDAWMPPVVVEPEPAAPDAEPIPADPATDGETVAPVAVDNDGLVPPHITELLPNPASPLTDADDEFIELYNSNTAAFDLEGYKLQVGTTTLHTFTFPAGAVIAPLSYLAFKSSETGLSLSNSGGQARLRDPAGIILSETTPYTSASDNQSWILVDNTWQWTSSATPGVANILAVPVAAIKAAKTTAPKPPKAAATKKATTKSAAKAKTTKAKTTKAKAAKKKVATTKAAAASIPEKPKPPIHMGILVAVAVAAVLYGLYEYRHDIAHKFRQLGRNRRAGVTDRLAPAGR